MERHAIATHFASEAELPDYSHSQDEKIYMIEGDLIIGDPVLGPGDFHIAEAGRRHPVHQTRTGCMCIISQAMDCERTSCEIMESSGAASTGGTEH